MSGDDIHPGGSEGLGPNAIAVIGMAGRFPGADSVTQFWDNLRAGKESIETLSEETLAAAGVSAKTLADPAYVRQMAIYTAVLGEIFPQRKIEAALVWTDGPKLMPVPEILMAEALVELGRSG